MTTTQLSNLARIALAFAKAKPWLALLVVVSALALSLVGLWLLAKLIVFLVPYFITGFIALVIAKAVLRKIW